MILYWTGKRRYAGGDRRHDEIPAELVGCIVLHDEHQPHFGAGDVGKGEFHQKHIAAPV